MEFYEAVEKRRSIRNFSDAKVSKEKIIKILKAGLSAPTYNHMREWDFILIKDETTRFSIVKAEGIPDINNMPQFEQSLAGYDPLSREMYLDAIPKQKSMLIRAPELLAVTFKPKTTVEKASRVYDLNCLASVWCCIENILLALTAEDLCGVTYIPQKTAKVKEVLGIPDAMELAALIPFGYPAETVKLIPQKNIRLNEKLHFEKW